MALGLRRACWQLALSLPSVLPSRCKHTVGARIAFFEAQFPARRCLCLRFTRRLAAPSARLEVKMVRYSFLVGLLPPRLHAGLSRRLRLLTVTAPIGAARASKRCFEYVGELLKRRYRWMAPAVGGDATEARQPCGPRPVRAMLADGADDLALFSSDLLGDGAGVVHAPNHGCSRRSARPTSRTLHHDDEVGRGVGYSRSRDAGATVGRLTIGRRLATWFNLPRKSAARFPTGSQRRHPLFVSFMSHTLTVGMGYRLLIIVRVRVICPASLAVVLSHRRRSVKPRA